MSSTKSSTKIVAAIGLGVGLAACGSGGAIDDVATLRTECETSQGIGWMKREYGENWCDCWVSAAKEGLSDSNYKTLVKASAEVVKAADNADRDKIYRQHTTLFSATSDLATRYCRTSP